MATIIKLTYSQTGRATLVNLDQMTSAYRIFDKATKKYATRISFQNDTFAIVDEELQTIKAISENALAGEYQDNDWVEVDAGEGEGFHERLQSDYDRNMNGGYNQRPYHNQRRNDYNNHYNNNNYNNRY